MKYLGYTINEHSEEYTWLNRQYAGDSWYETYIKRWYTISRCRTTFNSIKDAKKHIRKLRKKK